MHAFKDYSVNVIPLDECAIINYSLAPVVVMIHLVTGVQNLTELC